MSKNRTLRSFEKGEGNYRRRGQRRSGKSFCANIAALWFAYLDADIAAFDVRMMMALLKISRVKHGRSVSDSLVDIAGYASCSADFVIDDSQR